jgi:hypothetical protein
MSSPAPNAPVEPPRCIEPPAQRPTLARRVARIVLLNLVVLAAYRTLFVWWFGEDGTLLRLPEVLWQGLRIDVTLLSVELAALGVLALVGRYLRPSTFLAGLWLVTSINVVCVLLNLAFYGERRQHMWEMLLANVDRVSQIAVAAEPFVEAHVSAMLAALVGVAGFTALAVRDVRAASGPRRDLWREPRAVLALVGVVVLGLVVSVERVPTKRRSDGTKFRIAASKYLMQFPSHVLNQAVVNPLVDLAIYHLPAALKRPGYRLDEAQSLATTLRLLHLSPQDPAHPLLRSLHGDGGLGIRNVVVVMVEGLGTAILDHRAEDGAVMPFLAGLAAQGLYFPRCYQSFSSTDGSVFAVTTSLNRSFAAHARTPYFFPYEFGGSFGSLPRVLGSERYRHFFFAGFRQRIAEFVSFAANQGFEACGCEQLARHLRPRPPRRSGEHGRRGRPAVHPRGHDRHQPLAVGGPRRLRARTRRSGAGDVSLRRCRAASLRRAPAPRARRVRRHVVRDHGRSHELPPRRRPRRRSLPRAARAVVDRARGQARRLDGPAVDACEPRRRPAHGPRPHPRRAPVRRHGP